MLGLVRGWRGGRHIPPPWLDKLLFEYPADRGPADLDTRPYHLPRDGPSAKVLLGAELADLMNSLAYTFMQPIPGRRSQQLIRTILIEQRLLPRIDGVSMESESIGGLFGAPLSQGSQLHDLRPLLRREVGALSGRLGQPTGSKDLQLPFEQSRLGIQMIPLGSQPDLIVWIGQHTCSRDAIRLGQGCCNRINQVPHASCSETVYPGCYGCFSSRIDDLGSSQNPGPQQLY